MGLKPTVSQTVAMWIMSTFPFAAEHYAGAETLRVSQSPTWRS